MSTQDKRKKVLSVLLDSFITMAFQKKVLYPKMPLSTTLASIIHTERSISIQRIGREIIIRDIMHKMLVGPGAIGGLIQKPGLTTVLK